MLQVRPTDLQSPTKNRVYEVFGPRFMACLTSQAENNNSFMYLMFAASG